MGYRHLTIRLVARVIAIVMLAVAMGVMFCKNVALWISVLTACAELGLVIELVYFINSINRKITFFISAIRNNDTALKFPEQTGNSIINDLHHSLNELNIILQNAKINSRLKDQYFSTIIEHIGTGVLVFDNDGFVSEVNHSSFDLFGLQVITHISQISQIDKDFALQLMLLTDGAKLVAPLHVGSIEKSVMLECAIVTISNKQVHLVTLQDIHAELERKEVDAWKKLIRVLSHEIMNSLTPITSIAQTLESQWNSSKIATEEDVRNSIAGLSVISERCVGLARFVQSYRVLTNIPKPTLTEVSIASLFERFSIFTSPMRSQYNVNIHFVQPLSNFTVNIDEQMMMQVMINLVKNSAEALASTPKPDALVEVSAHHLPSGQTEIVVADNGPGIPDNVRDEIFVPFFTTKSTGSGIGLSYSQQVLRAHGGTIVCQSSTNGTIMKLLF